MQNVVVGRIGRRPPPVPETDPVKRRPCRGWEGWLHLRCRGRPIFRNGDALDLALTLDLDPAVEEWSCLAPTRLGGDGNGRGFRLADFAVTRADGTVYHLDVDVGPDLRPAGPGVEHLVARSLGLLGDVRVRNARGIMAYAGTAVSLPDQIRLLTRLEAEGSVSLLQAAAEMRGTDEPIGAVLALAARRVVRIDWTSCLIGPRTRIVAPSPVHLASSPVR